MRVFKSLPLGLILCIANVSPISSATSVSRALESIHGVALMHTRNLARDIRIAFRGILVAQQPSSSSSHTIYCKAGLGPLAGGGANNTSPSSSLFPSGTSLTGSPTGSLPHSQPTGAAATSSPWKLAESHQGNNFFDGWVFTEGGDPTHGIVQYVSEATGRSNGLVEVDSDGHAIMRVETTANVSSTRMSIRITTNSSHNGGLFIMDAVHMPTGCGIWPAFWTNGPNWPAGGEIDIVEAVNDYTNDQMTIHTNTGCTLPTADANALKISGTVIGGTDCAALTTGNQGCGIRSSSTISFGPGFNSNGGGTYAMQWDSSGIQVFFFPRGSEPSDITNGAPQPNNWGQPMAKWPASSCDPFKFFSDHSAIFDTTLCGDWAGAVWGVAGIPGQEQSCAQRTNVATCEEFVQNNGAAMGQAYWEVNYMKIYQFQG